MKSPDLAFLWLAAGPCSRSWSGRGLGPEVVDALRRQNVLRPADPPEAVECPSCLHMPETIEIQRQQRTDGSIRLYGICPECGVVDLTREDCLRYAVDYGAVTGLLSKGLGIEHPPEERKPGRCWKLGQARVGSKVRHIWACREDSGGDADFADGGVVFTLGPIRGDHWPDGVMRIPAGEVLGWKDGLAFDRDACDAYAEPPSAAPVRKRAPQINGKSAPRLNLIAGIVKELERYCMDARDDFRLAKMDKRKWPPEPPSQKYLALRFKVTEGTISKALNDPAGARAKALLENCASERFILDFKGKKRKKSGHPAD